MSEEVNAHTSLGRKRVKINRVVVYRKERERVEGEFPDQRYRNHSFLSALASRFSGVIWPNELFASAPLD